eukprot:jgi/Chrzof1/2605/Cz11g22060.t1
MKELLELENQERIQAQLRKIKNKEKKEKKKAKRAAMAATDMAPFADQDSTGPAAVASGIVDAEQAAENGTVGEPSNTVSPAIAQSKQQKKGPSKDCKVDVASLQQEGAVAAQQLKNATNVKAGSSQLKAQRGDVQSIMKVDGKAVAPTTASPAASDDSGKLSTEHPTGNAKHKAAKAVPAASPAAAASAVKQENVAGTHITTASIAQTGNAAAVAAATGDAVQLQQEAMNAKARKKAAKKAAKLATAQTEAGAAGKQLPLPAAVGNTEPVPTAAVPVQASEAATVAAAAPAYTVDQQVMKTRIRKHPMIVKFDAETHSLETKQSKVQHDNTTASPATALLANMWPQNIYYMRMGVSKTSVLANKPSAVSIHAEQQRKQAAAQVTAAEPAWDNVSLTLAMQQEAALEVPSSSNDGQTVDQSMALQSSAAMEATAASVQVQVQQEQQKQLPAEPSAYARLPPHLQPRGMAAAKPAQQLPPQLAGVQLGDNNPAAAASDALQQGHQASMVPPSPYKPMQQQQPVRPTAAINPAPYRPPLGPYQPLGIAPQQQQQLPMNPRMLPQYQQHKQHQQQLIAPLQSEAPAHFHPLPPEEMRPAMLRMLPPPGIQLQPGVQPQPGGFSAHPSAPQFAPHPHHVMPAGYPGNPPHGMVNGPAIGNGLMHPCMSQPMGELQRHGMQGQHGMAPAHMMPPPGHLLPHMRPAPHMLPEQLQQPLMPAIQQEQQPDIKMCDVPPAATVAVVPLVNAVQGAGATGQLQQAASGPNTTLAQGTPPPAVLAPAAAAAAAVGDSAAPVVLPAAQAVPQAAAGQPASGDEAAPKKLVRKLARAAEVDDPTILKPGSKPAAKAKHNALFAALQGDTCHDDFLCVVCMERPQQVMLMPCKHLVLCPACSDDVKSKNMTCPMCRTEITMHVKVHL